MVITRPPKWCRQRFRRHLTNRLLEGVDKRTSWMMEFFGAGMQ